MTTSKDSRRGVYAVIVKWWVGGWTAVLYQLLSLMSSVVSLVSVGGTLAFGIALLPFALLGVPFIAVCVLAATMWAGVERLLLQRLLGAVIQPPDVQWELPVWRRLLWSKNPWKSFAHMVTQWIWGPVGGTVVVLWATGAGLMLFSSLWLEWLIVTLRSGFGMPLKVDAQVYAWSLPITGAFLLLALPVVAKGLSLVDIQLGRWLLGTDPHKQLQQLNSQVATLTSAKAEVVDSAEAERRRIERDLHDGPQQRLVSVAMDISMAQDSIDDDPQFAKEILAQAHVTAKEAIAEMRQVARGITPPILSDRGLDAAISALAERSQVPVEVTVSLHGRLHATVESVAYFCVSETLTNIAKHSGATQASVTVTHDLQDDSRIKLVVSDNGCGGVDPRLGTGVSGLRQRVVALDGSFDVVSPVGGPTVVTVFLPDLPSRKQND